MPTAILIDGAYFVKRFRTIEPHNAYNATRAAEFAFRCAIAHLSEPGQKPIPKRRDLYRIFFYDCPPLDKKLHNPITQRAVDFAKSPEAQFRLALHDLLRDKRKVALRLGHLASDTPWTIKPQVIQDLLKKRRCWEDLRDDDVVPNARQKGVDMRIGIDISSLALKKQVDQIVLIAGDADFVPAAKLARREGVDFVLDPMWQSIPAGLNEHIDGLRSTCAKPKKRVESSDTNGALNGGGERDLPASV
ncbi:NYN domain-containing protein [Simplicispira lacusdiani]|uniref:NYN domain-containing protein n=1 Tax=Simplicispira lacusdiani TaxID=2213010 RepID=UPI000E750A8E|nr:NYN domain-containing protein [Simplicispira lacusdiani]